MYIGTTYKEAYDTRKQNLRQECQERNKTVRKKKRDKKTYEAEIAARHFNQRGR